MWDHRCLCTSNVAVHFSLNSVGSCDNCLFSAGALNCSEAVVLFVFDDSSSLMWCLVRQPFFYLSLSVMPLKWH